MKLIQRYINDVQNWAVNIKTLIIVHRCLQDKDLSQVMAKELKPKAHILQPYTKKVEGEGSYGKSCDVRQSHHLDPLSSVH